jgi:short-subunit dehydrogenase
MAPSRVLVTGCSTGIGRAIAKEFHNRGCVVLATARRAAAIADLAQDGIATAEVDVTKQETLDTALNEFGAVDIVVCNAGIASFQPLVEQPLSSIQSVMDTNVIGVMATVQAVADGMIKRRAGTIVVIGSVSAAMITPYAGAYCASKAAVAAMCEALQMELAPFDVSVMHVITGSVQSNFSNAALPRSILPAGSHYAPIADKVEERAKMSQNPATVMAADAYARGVCDAALSPRPPGTLLGGGKVGKFHFYGQWMPRSLLRSRLRATFGLSDLYAKLHGGVQPPSSSSWLARTVLLVAVAALAVPWVSHALRWLRLPSR